MRTLVAVLLSLLVLTSCSGSSGVEVSHDWSGITSYVVADVNHLATVVGIDPLRGRARSLIVIPDRGDDDRASGPAVARSGSETLVVRPRRTGAGTIYRVRAGDPAVTRVGQTATQARMLPSPRGWAEVVRTPTGGTVRLLDTGLQRGRTLSLPVRPDVAETDGKNHVCVAENDDDGARLATVGLRGSDAPAIVRLPRQVGVMACVDGHPIIGTSGGGASGGTESTFVLVPGPVPALEASEGRFDRLVVDGTTGYALVGLGATVRLYVVDLTTGAVIRSAWLSHLAVVDDAFIIGRTVVAVGEDRAAAYDLDDHAVRSFALPGRVFPN